MFAPYDIPLDRREESPPVKQFALPPSLYLLMIFVRIFFGADAN